MSSRTLLIFNDTFSGTSINATWEVHTDSATGTIASMGTLSSVMVPLGTMATQTISITRGGDLMQAAVEPSRC